MRRWGLCLLGWIAASGLGSPARAIEQVVLELPLLNSSFSLSISELRSPEALMAGNSDLAELDRASSGAVGRVIEALSRNPVPLTLTHLAEDSIGSPLLEQALLVVSSLGEIEGRAPDLSGETFKAALAAATARSGASQPTVLDLMEAIPGERVRVNLSEAAVILKRMLAQRQQADRLFAAGPASAPPQATPSLAECSRSHSAVAGGPPPRPPGCGAGATNGGQQSTAGVDFPWFVGFPCQFRSLGTGTGQPWLHRCATPSPRE